jgi:hypothetical protein
MGFELISHEDCTSVYKVTHSTGGSGGTTLTLLVKVSRTDSGYTATLEHEPTLPKASIDDALTELSGNLARVAEGVASRMCASSSDTIPIYKKQ